MAAVQEKFAAFRPQPHNPSDQQLRGLEENAKVLMAMAERNQVLRQHFYLSSLAPGIGKTTVNTEFVKVLLASTNPRYQDVGVLFLLSRCSEIARLVDEMKREVNLRDSDYSILVSRSTADCRKIYGKGNPNPNGAKVLFVTQANIETRTKYQKCAFGEVKQFYFNDHPRQVRIWDEAILPAEITTLGQYDIPHLFAALNKANETSVLRTLKAFAKKLDRQKDNSVLTVPDITAHGLTSAEAQNLFNLAEDQETVRKLWELAGHPVRVRHEGNAKVVLFYEDHLPPDLGPMLVTDASGGLRGVYRLWRKDRGGLCKLHSPAKSYAGLTIHHWNRKSGKHAAYGKHYSQGRKKTKEWKEIAAKIAETIRHVPDGEKVLVVKFKPSAYVADIEAEIKNHLSKAKLTDVSFIHYGIHTATSEYRDCKHIIIAGLLNYPLSQNDGYTGSSKGLSHLTPVGQRDINAVRRGEVKHNLFQAAARGNIRASNGVGCPPDNHVYVIFSTHFMPQSILTDTFPHARVVPWGEPKADHLRLIEVLRNGGKGGTFPKAKLREQVGGISAPTLRVWIKSITPVMLAKGQPISQCKFAISVPPQGSLKTTPKENR
jgi:hypothetical protein